MGRGSGLGGTQKLARQDVARLGLGSRSPAQPNPASRTIPLLLRPVELSEGERLTLLALADLERSDPERAQPSQLGESPGWNSQEISACGSLDEHGVGAASLVKILIHLERECLVEVGNLTRSARIAWSLSSESRKLFFAPAIAEEISRERGQAGIESGRSSLPKRRLMNW